MGLRSVSVYSCPPATTLDSRDEFFTGFVQQSPIPLRRPPARRRRQVLARATIPASSRPPFLPGARLRNRITRHKTRQAHRGHQT